MDYLVSLNEREGFSSEDLVAPIYEERPLETEKAPVFISPWKPGIKPQVAIILALNASDGEKKIDAYMGMGAVLNISLKNTGNSSLYIERVFVETTWDGGVSGEIKKYLHGGEERYMRHLLVPFPQNTSLDSSHSISIFFDIVIESRGSWYRREAVEYPSYPVNPLSVNPGIFTVERDYNPAYYFDKINDLVEMDWPQIVSLVENSSLGNGPYTIQKVVDAYEFVRNSLTYEADPDTGKNEWISPMTCLLEGGGDCEDFSVVLGSVITAMGGNARVIITHGHAFNAVYIGDDESLLTAINNRYGIEVPFLIWEDDLGKWLIIEPQSHLVFGWFPLDVEPVFGSTEEMYVHGYPDLGWRFVDSEEVSVVDIYFK
jgi:transglutaminase-like putative cysteine protease